MHSTQLVFKATTWLIAAVMLAGLLGGLAPVQAADPSEWAPPEVSLFLGITDCQKFEAQLHKTTLYRMSKDEQAKKLIEDWTKAFDEAMGIFARKLGLDNAEQIKIKPQGGAALMVLDDMPAADAMEEAPTHLAVVADYGENSGKLKELLERITTISVERGGEKEMDEFKGVRLVTIHPVETPETPGQEEQEEDTPQMGMPGMGMELDDMILQEIKDVPLPEKVTYATTGTITVFGSDSDMVKNVLRRITGDAGESLAKSKDYLALQRHCAPVGQVNMFVNLPRIMEIATAGDDDVKKEMQAWGLNAFRALVLSASFAPHEDTDYEIRGFLPVVGETRGISKMFTANVVNKSVVPDASFPQGTMLCGWMNFRIETLLDEIYEVRKRLDPEGAEMFRASMKVPTMEGDVVDLEAVVKNFTLPLKGYLSMSAPFARENVAMLFTLNHKGREAAAKLFEIIGPWLQKRDLMGQSVYDVAMMPIGVSLALSKAALAVGNTPGVEQMIRTGGEVSGANLAADAQFRQTLRRAPKEAWLVLYQDQMKSFEAMLAMSKAAKKAEAEGEAPPFGFDVTDNILNTLKQSPVVQMDNPEAMRNYMLSQLLTVSSSSKGVQFYANAVKSAKK